MIFGFENFQNSAHPGYGNLKPAMLLVGDDASAKLDRNRLACRWIFSKRV